MSTRKELVEFVGTGKLTAALYRCALADCGVQYRISIVHESRTRSTLSLGAEELLELPRLLQLVAQGLLHDGWLAEPLKEDVRYLLAAIDVIASQPQPYFVCAACDAKWFGRCSSASCPRCFTPATSRERLLIPWRRD